MGEYELIRGNKLKAIDLFRRALQVENADMYAYSGSRAELIRLGYLDN